MSLKDTIRGAREEAAANGTPFDRGTSAGDSASSASDAGSSAGAGFTRRSAARGKPTREAAAGVRMVTSDGKAKSKANLTKEEKKAERKHNREVEDQRYNVTQMILDENEEYKRVRKVWWRFLIVGIVFMVIALGLYGMVSNMGNNAPAPLAIASMVSMVVAYLIIIGGIIYDWRKIKPLREQAEKRTASMSEKKLRAALLRKAKKQ